MSIPQLGLRITQPNLQLYITDPNLQVHTQPPDLALKTIEPEVIIDLRSSFNSMGLKDIDAFMKDFTANARATVLKGIERRADEGDALGKAKGPSIGQLADQASKPEEKQLVIGLMPEAPPEISAKLGTIDGEYTPGDVSVHLEIGKVNGVFTWGKVEGYLEGQSIIDIKA